MCLRRQLFGHQRTLSSLSKNGSNIINFFPTGGPSFHVFYSPLSTNNHPLSSPVTARTFCFFLIRRTLPAGTIRKPENIRVHYEQHNGKGHFLDNICIVLNRQTTLGTKQSCGLQFCDVKGCDLRARGTLFFQDLDWKICLSEFLLTTLTTYKARNELSTRTISFWKRLATSRPADHP